MPSPHNRLAFAPVTVLICAGIIGMAFAAGTRYPVKALSNRDSVVSPTEIRPAHCLRLIGKSLDLQCRRCPTHTVTLDQEDVDRVYNLSKQVCNEEEARRTRKQKDVPTRP